MRDTCIEIFEGLLGGGKTFSAVDRILKHIGKGFFVVSNIRLNWEKVAAYCLEKWSVQVDRAQYVFLEQDQVFEFHKHVFAGRPDAPVLLVIDEAHLFFNARDWAKTSRAILELNTQVRKLHLHMILITQNRLNLDKQFLRMVQFFVLFRDMQKIKIPFLPFHYPLPQILVLVHNAQCPGLDAERRFVYKDPAIFGCYESTDLLKTIDLSMAPPPVTGFRKVERKSGIPWRKAVLTCAGLGVLGAVYGFRSGPETVSDLPDSVVDVSPDVVEETVAELPVYSGLYTIGDVVFYRLDTGWKASPASNVEFVSGGIIVSGVQYTEKAIDKGLPVEQKPVHEKDTEENEIGVFGLQAGELLNGSAYSRQDQGPASSGRY